MKVISPDRLFNHKNISEVRQEHKQMREAAEGFEAMFLKFFYNNMAKNTMQEDITGEVSNARKIFNGMLMENYAEKAAGTDGVGIADVILRDFGFEPERGISIKGKIVRNPVIGRVSSDYGDRIHPVNGEVAYHYGVDIVPDPDIKGSDRIKAPLPGVVRYSGSYGSYGNVILVEHPGGYKTIYAHNEENYVKTGEFIKKGQVIGKVGSSGESTGKHLHFEVRNDRTPIDPSVLL